MKMIAQGKRKNRFDVENQKQHRHDVVTHRKSIVCAGFRIDASIRTAAFCPSDISTVAGNAQEPVAARETQPQKQKRPSPAGMPSRVLRSFSWSSLLLVREASRCSIISCQS
jgi:hypothetical protein